MRGSIPTERERSQCKLIKAGGRAWGCFQANQSADACSCVWNINMSLVQPLSTPCHHHLLPPSLALSSLGISTSPSAHQHAVSFFSLFFFFPALIYESRACAHNCCIKAHGLASRGTKGLFTSAQTTALRCTIAKGRLCYIKCGATLALLFLFLILGLFLYM